MEIIKKIISLEDSISRQGCLIPYVGMEKDAKGDFILNPNGCWGHYPYDVNIELCEGFESLKEYFICEGVKGRCSYSHAINKWRTFESYLKNATFYKRIKKKGALIWVKTKPSFREKIHINIISNATFNNTPIEEFDENIVGVLKNDDFNEKGGHLMLDFLLKYVGLFEVDSDYITIDNYVPEMLYYCELDEQIKKLEGMKNSGECCKTQEYIKFGGDEFLNYLCSKQIDRKKEFKYWEKALYKHNQKNIPPSIYIPITLLGECKHIGTYSICEPPEEYDLKGEKIQYEGTQFPDYGETKNEPLVTVTSSKLIEFKRRKETQFLNTETRKMENMPIVMNETQEDSFYFRVTPRYLKGNAINLSEKDGKYYGDVINEIEPIDEGNMKITYVIGGELRKTNENEKDSICPELDNYRYVENSRTGIVYTETVKYEYIDFTKGKLYQYTMLVLDREMNILNPSMVKNINNALVIYDSENENVDGLFYMDYPDDMTNYRVFMKDYNFGKIENLIENVDEIILDRGYASAFEIHYKLGEINSFEDMQNYQNNIFGL